MHREKRRCGDHPLPGTVAAPELTGISALRRSPLPASPSPAAAPGIAGRRDVALIAARGSGGATRLGATRLGALALGICTFARYQPVLGVDDPAFSVHPETLGDRLSASARVARLGAG